MGRDRSGFDRKYADDVVERDYEEIQLAQAEARQDPDRAEDLYDRWLDQIAERD